MPCIIYDRIPCEEKKSTGEHVIKNAFFMPQTKTGYLDLADYHMEDRFGVLLGDLVFSQNPPPVRKNFAN